MIKHIQIIRRLWATNSLSVFDHFEGLALKGLKSPEKQISGKYLDMLIFQKTIIVISFSVLTLNVVLNIAFPGETKVYMENIVKYKVHMSFLNVFLKKT